MPSWLKLDGESRAATAGILYLFHYADVRYAKVRNRK